MKRDPGLTCDSLNGSAQHAVKAICFGRFGEQSAVARRKDGIWRSPTAVDWFTGFTSPSKN